MSFTNDDLKRLKERGGFYYMQNPEIMPLIARLEAAELALQLYEHMNYREDDPDDWTTIANAVKVWEAIKSELPKEEQK